MKPPEFNFLCGRIGGFWCSSTWADLLGTALLLLIGVILLLAIFWLIRKKQYDFN